MSEEIENIDDFSGLPKTLPNATATLVLGIVSIATCWLYGVPGVVCGIIALVLAKKDKAIYDSDPSAYANSYKNSQAGKICGLIGLILSGLFMLYIIFALIFVFSVGNPYMYR